MELHGAKQWTLVASHLKGRLGKQCRERWHNHLNPAIKHGQWTREEDEVIVRFHRAHGNQVGVYENVAVFGGWASDA